MTKRNIQLLVLVSVGFLMIGCQSFVNFYSFHPDRHDVPDTAQLPPGVEEIFLSTSDGESLHCYWLERPAASHLLIYFHGNAGNISHRIPDLMVLADMGVKVLGVGYRGYGKSSGKPSEEGIYLDGRAALDYVSRTHGVAPEKVILLGRSIGSTVAVERASQEQLAALVLVTPLTSGRAMGKHHGFGFLANLAGDAFNNLDKIETIRCPLLIVHGTRDEIVPFSMGEQLYALAPKPKFFKAIEGVGHNDISTLGAGAYWRAIREFVVSLPLP